MTPRSDGFLDLARFETARADVQPARYTVHYNPGFLDVRQPPSLSFARDMLTDATGLLRLTAPDNLVSDTWSLTTYIASSRHYFTLPNCADITATRTMYRLGGDHSLPHLYKVRPFCYTLPKPESEFTTIPWGLQPFHETGAGKVAGKRATESE